MAQLTLSGRLPADLTPSEQHRALQGETPDDVCDLTESNPTVCGFDYPTLALPLLGPQTWRYAPEATGSAAARAHLARYYTERGAKLDAGDVVLTASTSEAYSSLFKLLCDPGQCVATATPGYPLVPHLAELDGVGLRYFRWHDDGGVHQGLDMASVRACLQAGVRALVLVQPSSPLGERLTAEALKALSALCTKASVVLIIDAVFEAYTPEGGLTVLPDALYTDGATIVLGGLSKAGGMPQLKLGWMRVHGCAAWTTPLHQGLEWISDAYLSVASPVQTALPRILPHLEPIQRQIRARIATNYRALQIAMAPLARLLLRPYRGGWYAVFEGPCDTDEDALVRVLHKEAHVLVHPGYFYDFDKTGLWVLNLIVPSDAFAAALPRMVPVLDRALGPSVDGVKP